jgi:hypothetical protein
VRLLELQLDLPLFDLLVWDSEGLQEVDRLKNVDAVLEVDGPVELLNLSFKDCLHVLLVVLLLEVVVVVAHVNFIADR